MARKQIDVLLLGLVVCGVLSATGCGRTGQRSALLPRVDVADIMDGGVREGTQDLPSEQYVNNQIDQQLREAGSGVEQAANNVVASAEQGIESWKKILPGSRKSEPSEPIGKDPFLDSIDEIIAKDAEAAKQTSRDTVSSSVDRALDRISGSDAGEMFADLPEQTRQRSADLMAAAEDAIEEASANTSDVFGAVKEDVFGAETEEMVGAATEDVFGAPETTIERATNVVQNGLEQVSQASQGRRSLAQQTGAIVHRFDELFDEEAVRRQPEVQQVVNETRDTFAETAESARFRAEEFVTEIADASANALAEVEGALEEPVLPPAEFDATADMFEPPAEIPVPAELPEMPEMPERGLPAPPEIPGLRVANIDQKDAVVTPNAPATLPDMENAFAVEMPESSPSALDRIAVDDNDPIFSEPSLPSVDEIPEVAIPDLNSEPAPRFTEVVSPERPQLTARPATSTNLLPAQPASTTAPIAASVLPDVDWQGQGAAPKRAFTAPSEWTAWFLMGGAALIVLLLFAPSRRDS